jgi:plasmid stability protein
MPVMATLTIRQLDDAVYEQLKRDAKANHRSIEAEARYRLALPRTERRDHEPLAERFRKIRVTPGPGYEGSVALVRAIRDEE